MPDVTHSYKNKEQAEAYQKKGYLKIYLSEMKRLTASLPKGKLPYFYSTSIPYIK